MIIDRALTALGLATRSEDAPTPAPGAVPPARAASRRSDLHLLNVYRAIQIHATAAQQLSLHASRNGLHLEPTPALLRQPQLGRSAGDFFSGAIIDLATCGNFFWLKHRNSEGQVFQLEAFDPHQVTIWQHERTGAIRFTYNGKDYTSFEVEHGAFMRRSSQLAGLGPIQAARNEIDGSHNLTDYATKWFTDSGVPSGVLRTDQNLSPDRAKEWREAWNSIPAGQTRVLGQGLAYQAIHLSPADAQFLENRQFNTTEIARLFGIPASLFAMAIEGGSMTYSNLEQDLTVYQRFGLMTYLAPIEAAFTAMLPHTQKAKFNLEGLLRTDTLTRYQAHKLAIEMGLYDATYARQIEGIQQ